MQASKTTCPQGICKALRDHEVFPIMATMLEKGTSSRKDFSSAVKGCGSSCTAETEKDTLTQVQLWANPERP